MTTLETLRQARALLARPHGWGKGRFMPRRTHPDVPRYCAVGAIQHAAARIPPASVLAAEAELNIALNKLYNYQFPGVTSFNDRRTTTKAQVLELFDHAIANLEITI